MTTSSAPQIRVALVTGAASGIGRAIALAWAREGAAVVVSDMEETGGRETVALAEAAGAQALFVAADVARPEHCEALVQQAYLARVQLWSDGFYATPGLHWNKATLQGRPFHYYAYGAAVSEVVVDTLTGEHRLLAADIVHDAGRSLNPAIDIGQVEGAFIQGMGWLTMEELVWHPDDGSARAGLLMTHAPSTYKIPTANDAPAVFRTTLFDAPNRVDAIHRSKAVGEPPLLLPISVLLAIRDAVSALGGHAVCPPLDAPATPEAVLRAVQAVREGRSACA
jgi:xanthine dehydrogenase large subunit